jgi:excisionase family DNA binding protein
MNNWLNVKEATEFLKVSRCTIYRYCRKGFLPHYKKKYGLRFKADELEKWLEQSDRNVLTNAVPVDIEALKGGNCELAKKKPTCLKYGRVYMRTYRSGRSSWTIDYRDETDKRVQKALPHAQSKEEAILALQKRIVEAFDRKQDAGRSRREIGFSNFSEIYLQHYAMITKRSWRTDASQLKVMNEFFKDIELREISPLMIQKFRAWRLKEGNTKSTVNRYTALLKRMFSIAVEEGYADMNPVKKLKFFPEKDAVRERILTEREEERLLETCSDALRPILVIALNTGMRKSEILNLRRDQVDLKARIIRVEKTKGGKVRHIPINDSLLNELRRNSVDRQNPFVFFNPETMKPYVDLKKGFKAACRRAGIKGLRFHDLRHTFASRLVAKGTDIETVRDLLGHHSITVTQRYTHSSDDRKKTAVELLCGEKCVTQLVTQEEESKLIH